MGLYSVEVYSVDCDSCGDTIVGMSEGYESDYDAIDAAEQMGAITIDGDTMCESCSDDFRLCGWCEEYLYEPEAFYCEKHDEIYHDNGDCAQEGHAYRDFNGSQQFGTQCEACGTQYGKTLRESWTVNTPLPGFKAEKEAT